MAGKSPFSQKRNRSKLRDVIYKADPDELVLKPNESVAAIPLHGVEQGFEFDQHAISYQFQGRWGKVNCNSEQGDCPFCEDERNDVNRTLIRTVMVLLDPKDGKILYYLLPLSVVRLLMKWEDNLQDDPAEEKTETVRGKKVVFSREGSGITTSYVANVYGDVSDKYPLGPYQDEIARVVSKVEKTFAPTDPDTQRAILKSGMLQFPKRKGGDAAEEDEIKPTTVEEEDW